MIGAGAIILPKIEIGAGCVIGAGAVVTKNIPAGSLAVGNPAKVVHDGLPLIDGSGSAVQATKLRRKVKVHLYTIVWNEEEMLPFFFRHYDSLVNRYVIYDDGSTDNTLKMLAAHDRVEVRPFVRTAPHSYVLSAQSLHDSCGRKAAVRPTG